MRNILCSILTIVLVACSDDADPNGSNAGSGGGMPGAGSGGSGGSGGAGGSAPLGSDGDASFEIGGPGQCSASGVSRAALGELLEPVELGISVNDIRATSAGLYVLGRGADARTGLYRVAPGASTATLLVPQLVAAGGLTSSAGHVVWSSAPDVDAPESWWSIPIGTDDVEPTLVLGEAWQLYERFTIDDTQLYAWTEAGSLSAVALDGGSPAVIGSAPYLAHMEAHGGYLYYAARATSVFASDAIVRIPSMGGPEEGMFSYFGIIDRFVLDDDAFYLAGEIGFERYDRADPSVPKLFYRHPEDLLTVGQMVEAMIVEGDRIFFTDSGNNVGWVATDGSDCGLLVDEFTAPTGNVDIYIQLDATHLYIHEWNAAKLYRLSRADFGI